MNPILPEQQENQSIHEYFLQFTAQLNKISCVIFAFYAGKLIKHLDPKVINCLNLVEQWLKNPNSVTSTELQTAASFAASHAEPYCPAIVNLTYFVHYVVNNNCRFAHSDAAWVAHLTVHAYKNTKSKLLNYISYLLPKDPELNNFNIDLLKQNPQAYSFLETISKLEDWQVTEEDLFGIRQIFDVLEEVGAPLDPNEFIWDGETTEKHKLLQAIRREFS